MSFVLRLISPGLGFGTRTDGGATTEKITSRNSSGLGNDLPKAISDRTVA